MLILVEKLLTEHFDWWITYREQEPVLLMEISWVAIAPHNIVRSFLYKHWDCLLICRILCNRGTQSSATKCHCINQWNIKTTLQPELIVKYHNTLMWWTALEFFGEFSFTACKFDKAIQIILFVISLHIVEKLILEHKIWKARNCAIM